MARKTTNKKLRKLSKEKKKRRNRVGRLVEHMVPIYGISQQDYRQLEKNKNPISNTADVDGYVLVDEAIVEHSERVKEGSAFGFTSSFMDALKRPENEWKIAVVAKYIDQTLNNRSPKEHDQMQAEWLQEGMPSNNKDKQVIFTLVEDIQHNKADKTMIDIDTVIQGPLLAVGNPSGHGALGSQQMILTLDEDRKPREPVGEQFELDGYIENKDVSKTLSQIEHSKLLLQGQISREDEPYPYKILQGHYYVYRYSSKRIATYLLAIVESIEQVARLHIVIPTRFIDTETMHATYDQHSTYDYYTVDIRNKKSAEAFEQDLDGIVEVFENNIEEIVDWYFNKLLEFTI